MHSIEKWNIVSIYQDNVQIYMPGYKLSKKLIFDDKFDESKDSKDDHCGETPCTLGGFKQLHSAFRKC